jgi:CRISPR-associated protein Csd2
MNRYDLIYLFDVLDANPNGDPDAGNLPRIDPETGQGLTTDVMLKRKIRNYVQTVKDDTSPNKIYVQTRDIALSSERKSAVEQKGKSPKDFMCEHYFDVRSFGAVMSMKEANCGQVRGPVQLSFARSIDRIVTAEHAITRCSAETEKEINKETGDNRTMGRKFTVPYALYRAHGFINPFLAAQTGFSDTDRELLFTALENAFQFDQSAARPAGSMNPRGLLVFEHSSQLGDAPSHKLFEAVTIARKPEVEVPRAFSDYEVKIDAAGIPAGVKLIQRPV